MDSDQGAASKASANAQSAAAYPQQYAAPVWPGVVVVPPGANVLLSEEKLKKLEALERKRQLDERIVSVAGNILQHLADELYCSGLQKNRGKRAKTNTAAADAPASADGAAASATSSSATSNNDKASAYLAEVRKYQERDTSDGVAHTRPLVK